MDCCLILKMLITMAAPEKNLFLQKRVSKKGIPAHWLIKKYTLTSLLAWSNHVAIAQRPSARILSRVKKYTRAYTLTTCIPPLEIAFLPIYLLHQRVYARGIVISFSALAWKGPRARKKDAGTEKSRAVGIMSRYNFSGLRVLYRYIRTRQAVLLSRSLAGTPRKVCTVWCRCTGRSPSRVSRRECTMRRGRGRREREAWERG